MPSPEVYRFYCAGEEMFGWIVRRYPSGRSGSPWVAHARGTEYVRMGEAPESAKAAAQLALVAAGLLDSFGCVDLIRDARQNWLCLEVGTDGLNNHVDRAVGDFEFASEILRQIAKAFWRNTALI